MSQVKIDDVDVCVFIEFLGYIYSGQVPKLNLMDEKLLAIADKVLSNFSISLSVYFVWSVANAALFQYQVESLKTLCGQYLKSKLDDESFADILLLSEKHTASELNAKCIEYFSRNALKVKVTQGWKKLDAAKRNNLMKQLSGWEEVDFNLYVFVKLMSVIISFWIHLFSSYFYYIFRLTHLLILTLLF